MSIRMHLPVILNGTVPLTVHHVRPAKPDPQALVCRSGGILIRIALDTALQQRCHGLPAVDRLLVPEGLRPALDDAICQGLGRIAGLPVGVLVHQSAPIDTGGDWRWLRLSLEEADGQCWYPVVGYRPDDAIPLAVLLAELLRPEDGERVQVQSRIILGETALRPDEMAGLCPGDVILSRADGAGPRLEYAGGPGVRVRRDEEAWLVEEGTSPQASAIPDDKVLVQIGMPAGWLPAVQLDAGSLSPGSRITAGEGDYPDVWSGGRWLGRGEAVYPGGRLAVRLAATEGDGP